MFAQHLGNSENQVVAVIPSRNFPVSLKPTTSGIAWKPAGLTLRLLLRSHQRPTQHAKAVDHGGVRVSTNECIG